MASMAARRPGGVDLGGSEAHRLPPSCPRGGGEIKAAPREMAAADGVMAAAEGVGGAD